MRLRPGSVFAVKEDLSEDGKVDHDLKTTANNELEKNRINWLNLFFFKSLYWFATFTTISMKFTLIYRLQLAEFQKTDCFQQKSNQNDFFLHIFYTILKIF